MKYVYRTYLCTMQALNQVKEMGLKYLVLQSLRVLCVIIMLLSET